MAKQMVLPEPQSEMFERSLKMVAKAIPAERLAILFTKDTPEQLYTAALHAPGGKDTGDFKLSRTVVSEILENQNSYSHPMTYARAYFSLVRIFSNIIVTGGIDGTGLVNVTESTKQ